MNNDSSSNSDSQETSILDRVSKVKRFGLSPRDVWLGMVIIAALVGVLLVQLPEEMPWEFLLATTVFFGLAAWKRQGWAIFCIIGMLVLMRFIDYDPSSTDSNHDLSNSDLLLVVLLMLFAGLSFRFLELSRYLQGYWAATEEAKYRSSKPIAHFPASIGGRWWLLPLAIGLAALLLAAFPFDPLSGRKIGIKPFASRPIFMGFFLFFAWFGFRSLIGLISGWKMQPEQASIRARSLVAKEFWKEHSAIEKRRAKIRDRELR